MDDSRDRKSCRIRVVFSNTSPSCLTSGKRGPSALNSHRWGTQVALAISPTCPTWVCVLMDWTSPRCTESHWASDQGTIQRDHHMSGGAIDQHHLAVLSCQLHANRTGQSSNDEQPRPCMMPPCSRSRSSNTSLNLLATSPQMTVEGNSVSHTR